MSENTDRAAALIREAQDLVEKGLDEAIVLSGSPATTPEAIALVLREYEVLQLFVDAIRLMGNELEDFLRREVTHHRSDRMAAAT